MHHAARRDLRLAAGTSGDDEGVTGGPDAAVLLRFEIDHVEPVPALYRVAVESLVELVQIMDYAGTGTGRFPVRGVCELGVFGEGIGVRLQLMVVEALHLPGIELLDLRVEAAVGVCDRHQDPSRGQSASRVS